MRIDVWARANRGLAVVHCVGDIIYQREADHVSNVIKLVQRDQVILDLEGVRSLDAYGIGKLIEARNWMMARNRALALVNPSFRLQELFRITKVNFRFTPLDKSFSVEDEGLDMSQLAKALFAKCPKCGRTSVQPVETYKTALQASRERSFECEHCAAEYFAPVQHIRCGVTDIPPASTGSIHS
jgi:anti-anti-sigma factor